MVIFFEEDLWYINPAKFDSTYSKSFIKNDMILKYHTCDWIVCGLFERKWICAGLSLFVYFFCACLTPVPWFLMSYVMVFFYVQWVEMRGGCSLCWYWWNYWPSLYKFLFTMDIQVIARWRRTIKLTVPWLLVIIWFYLYCLFYVFLHLNIWTLSFIFRWIRNF